MTRDKRLELGVGLFVLLGLAAIVYLTVKLGAGALVGSDTYPLEARFGNTGGLNKGSTVMLGASPSAGWRPSGWIPPTSARSLR